LLQPLVGTAGDAASAILWARKTLLVARLGVVLGGTTCALIDDVAAVNGIGIVALCAWYQYDVMITWCILLT
jgi:hypothetical protein